ncbi:hypothetical protein P4H71_03260 [Paenibacillus kribbensis]|uniref:hypothetical protein n=1 Tax=Paenibacillus kribbensis TaxID=172713 RepID=UPI002DBCBACE|nr:hypothetical protein [Paenibacillus kribbensis]MEC0233372.1 hypothetical protein [Paenibacillus kribbensis]
MIDYKMKNIDKLVCIQYDISIRFSILASAIRRGSLTNFQQPNGDFPVLGQVI